MLVCEGAESSEGVTINGIGIGERGIMGFSDVDEIINCKRSIRCLSKNLSLPVKERTYPNRHYKS